MKMNQDQSLSKSYPSLNNVERRFIRYFGAMARTWGTERYHRLSYQFSREFPAGQQTADLMHRIANILLGETC